MTTSMLDQPLALTSVSTDFIDQCLALYTPAGIHIRDVRYGDGVLEANFRLYNLDFHRRPLKHLSRVQLVHFIGQAAFVLGGCMARDGRLSSLNESQYLRLVEDGEVCTFRKLQLRFRRFIPNADGVGVRMSSQSVKRSRTHFMSAIRFEFDQGACVGSAHALIPTSTIHA